MKRLYPLLLALVATLCAGAQAVLPEFSTEADPVWYKVQFKTGAAFLTDQGTGKNLKTAATNATDNQKWQFIGTKDNFLMRSKAGNFVSYAGSRFTTAAEGIALKLAESGGYWEIQRQSATGQSMNQWGGAGAGKELGEWSSGDANNPVSFQVAQAVPPVFSTDEKTQWYIVQFCQNSTCMKAQGPDQPLVQSATEKDDALTWKLIGSKDNFQLVNKLTGQYAVATGSGDAARIALSAQPYDKGFCLVETANANFPNNWEIHLAGTTGKVAFNLWQGAIEGNPIGLWNANDQNNPLRFVDPNQIPFDDYKVLGAETFTPESPLTLWYRQPATLAKVADKWMEYALPIGNGSLGASIYGGLLRDELQFNEKTLWEGGPNDMGGYGGYRNFGSVLADNLSQDCGFSTADAARSYARFLDIEQGVAGVDYLSHDGRTAYTRRYLASYPDRAIQARYEAQGDSTLHLRFSFKPGTGINASAVTYQDAEASFQGKLTTVFYNARFHVQAEGPQAKVITTDQGIEVADAQAATLTLVGLTSYDDSKASCTSGDAQTVAQEVQERVSAAAQKGWQAVYQDHVADFLSLTHRCQLKIEGAASPLPTDELVQFYNNSSKNVTGREPDCLFLEQLYFAYGRYLAIGSSRGYNVPNNLQGIWNHKERAPWNADIHTNINIQMNYWPTETTNLSELHLPFLNFIINMAARPNYQRAAQRGGQTKGWTVFTESNIFGGMSTWGSNYFVANAWYCSHLWQHYRYTLDKDFLARAFPAMWSCAEFWMQRLILDRTVMDGTYVAPDEYSPEQDAHNKEDGTAHAQQLIYALFESVKQSLDILGQQDCGLSDADVQKLNLYLEKTDRGLHTETFKGEGWTQWAADKGIKKGDILLKEWKYACYDVSNDKGHRHMSHLMGLFPLSQIGPSSPYFQPAVNALRLRGDAATGWSMGWKVNLWARALDGDHAHTILHNALRHSTSYGTNAGAGGVYYNLYDSHAPFQIDGNFGVCSGVAEMLLQSHTDTLQLLPALPSLWQNGEATGLKAVGDFTVSMKWADAQITEATIQSNLGQPLHIKSQGIASRRFQVDGQEVYPTVVDQNTVSLTLEKGKEVHVDFTQQATPLDALRPTVADTGAAKPAVYDLQGRRRARTAESGIYVVDGQKTIVR